MDSSFLYLFAALSGVYAVAVIVKVAGIWKQPDARYEFKMWDGGLLMRGKSMSKHSAVGFAIVMVVLSAALLYMAAERGNRRQLGAAPPAQVEKLARSVIDCQPRG